MPSTIIVTILYKPGARTAMLYELTTDNDVEGRVYPYGTARSAYNQAVSQGLWPRITIDCKGYWHIRFYKK